MKSWISMLDLPVNEKEILDNILKNIDYYPNIVPYVLTGISTNLFDYKKKCKKQNDHDLREALGDACSILGRKRLPSLKDLSTLYCQRIKETIFKDGIEQYHHEGERNFFEKMGWGKKDN